MQDKFKEKRHAMVDGQLIPRGIKDTRVLDAMRRVPRHSFVRAGDEDVAYQDGPLPIGHDQTISQPYIVAIMSELLQLKGSERVLEIGTGCGYQAAVLALLAREVHSVEIVAPLYERAGLLLKDHKNVALHCGDGFRGWPDASPYQGILVAASPRVIPPALLEQLADGGRLVLPVGEDRQELMLIKRRGDSYERKSILPVRFVPMTGLAQRQ